MISSCVLATELMSYIASQKRSGNSWNLFLGGVYVSAALKARLTVSKLSEVYQQSSTQKKEAAVEQWLGKRWLESLTSSLQHRGSLNFPINNSAILQKLEAQEVPLPSIFCCSAATVLPGLVLNILSNRTSPERFL